MSTVPGAVEPAVPAVQPQADIGATGGPAPAARCPQCGAERIPGAAFCEECSYEFEAPAAGTPAPSTTQAGAGNAAVVEEAATPVTAAAGEESPLDVGWTGPTVPNLRRGAGSAIEEGGPAELVDGPVCVSCGEGHYLDGYCDSCGSKQPDPRDHFTEEPQSWVAGVCDIGRRHRRNEDAMALFADAEALSFAGLVVCDGVSNSTDSHVASLAAGRAAREVMRAPLSRGVGTRAALVAAAEQRLADAVDAADKAVEATTVALGETEVENPPSCTFVAALVARFDDRPLAVVGNVGDSRAYWLPDAPGSTPRQLSQDDSFAAEQMSAGVPRKEAETGAGAHAITRWLGSDSPDDLTPHTTDLDLDEDGWLMVCSDGLWNYCSEADDLRTLVQDIVSRLGESGLNPLALARALTAWANEQGGVDNITVTLVRVGEVAPAATAATAGVEPVAAPASSTETEAVGPPAEPHPEPAPQPHDDGRETP